MQKTSIQDLLLIFNEDHQIEKIEQDSKQDPYNLIFDFSSSLQDRMEAFQYLYETQPEVIEEITSHLSIMYRFSPISSIRNYIVDIIMNTSINISIKLDLCYTLCVQESGSDKGFECLNNCCSLREFNDITNICISLTDKINAIFTLYQYDTFQNNCIDYIIKLLHLYKDNNFFIYKNIIQSSYSILDIRHWVKICWDYINMIDDYRYKIYTLQLFLAYRTNMNSDDLNKCQNYLSDISKNETLNENTRADACDVLLQMGDKEYSDFASDMLIKLGTNSTLEKTIYNNSQNVHNKTIEQGALNIILKLKEKFQSNEYKTIESYNKWNDYLSQENDPVINKALQRISIDHTIFRNLPNTSLRDIFCLCCEYIEQSEYKSELYKRLVEELKEMHDTCSSGFLTRFANVFSGFENFHLNISVEDDFVTKFSNKINKYIQQSENYIDILSSMTCVKYEDKLVFLQFLRKHISDIREDLKIEYKDMDETDFDLYFKKCMLIYEI